MFLGSSISNLLSAVQSFPIFLASNANNDNNSPSSSSNALINNNNHIKTIISSSSNNANNNEHHVNHGTVPPAIASQLHQQQQPVAATAAPSTSTTASKCNEVSAIWAPCMCSLEMCIGWYPCGLKYCKGKQQQQQQQADTLNAINGSASSSYRCGIKTCRKCFHYVYYVRQKQQCLWDEWPQGVMGGISKTGKNSPIVATAPVSSYLFYDLNKLFSQVMHHIL